MSLVFLLGTILRLTLFLVSPPNNSFDDHLEVINYYLKTNNRPSPSLCWECYQPPMYYLISAFGFKAAKYVNASTFNAWKSVQFINTILSILVLAILYKTIKRFNSRDSNAAFYLSFLAVLPIDIFTSSMIGNDYLLVFSSSACLYYYLTNIEYLEKYNSVTLKNFICLSFFVIIGSLSKQHGIILLSFPAFIVILHIIRRNKTTYTQLLPILATCIMFSISNELWTFYKTGTFLISNQHFFNYAINQFPGSVEKVEFTTFRIYSLFLHPFLSDITSASFPTEIFARTFFDYEWRFVCSKIPNANLVGRIAYFIGVVWLIYFLAITVLKYPKMVKTKIKFSMQNFTYSVPIIVAALFLFVPILQTLRFPYFSSMKTTFMLPGIIILLSMHALNNKNCRFQSKFMNGFTILNMVFGMILVVFVSKNLGSCIDNLSGPLWRFP